MFIRIDMIHGRDRQTDRRTDRRTPHDGIERAYAEHRAVKTWLRSRMSEGRLTGLALLHIHRDIPVCAQAVIERFAKRKKRFLDFVM